MTQTAPTTSSTVRAFRVGAISEAVSWLRLIVATVAQQWRFALVPNHPVVPQPLVTLRAKHGMKMIASRRSVN